VRPVDRADLQARQVGADVAVFDPVAFRDVATFDDPKHEPDGLSWVIVNGALTYDRGRHTGARAGRLLRHSLAA